MPMSMLDFFKKVLPAQPDYVLSPGAMKPGVTKMVVWNESFPDFASMIAKATQYDKRGVNVWFALGSFADNIVPRSGREPKVERKALQSTFFKTLACDIDAGETKANTPYKTTAEAAAALGVAAKTLGLPAPMVILSGQGLHAYWPLDADVPRETWVTVSTALRGCLQDAGLSMDPSKVCDASMVLRPPGTHNKGVLVKVLRDCPLYKLDTFSFLLAKYAYLGFPPPNPMKNKKQSAMLDAVLGGTPLPPGDGAQIEQKCQQIAEIARLHGDVAEPLWRLAMGVAAHCEDAEAVAVRWSDGHPKYTIEETRSKMENWKANTTGPATCAKFESENAAGCKGCQYKGSITSPIRLSTPAPAVIPATTFVPPGYILTDDAVMKVVNGLSTPICNFPLIVTDRRYDAATGKTVAVLQATTQTEGVKEILLPIDTLTAGKTEWNGFLYNNNIIPGKYAANLEDTRYYVMTYLEELQHRVAPTQVYSHFGWYDDKFVLGSSLYSATGIEQIRLSPLIGKDFINAVHPHGTLDGWKEATKFYGIKGMEQHAMALLMGMGTPLLGDTSLEGFTLSMWGRTSGSGKTTSGAMMNSIWGMPLKIKIGKDDTMNAAYRMVSTMHNLPVFFDEATNTPPDEASKLIYNISNGRERNRMNQMAEIKESHTWKTMLALTTNSSFKEKVLANRSHSDGELQRLIEYSLEANAVFNNSKASNSSGMKILHIIEDNYGVAGPLLISAYCRIEDRRGFMLSCLDALRKEFNFEFQSKERFTQGAAVIAYAAGRIGSRLNIINFDWRAAIQYHLNHILSERENEKADTIDPVDVLGMFTGDNHFNTLTERIDSSMTGSARVIDTTHLRGELRARFEIIENSKKIMESGRMFVDRVHFRKWCNKAGIDASYVVAQMKRDGISVVSLRVSLGRRTSDVTTVASWCYQIDLMHPKFAGRINNSSIGNTMLISVAKSSN